MKDAYLISYSLQHRMQEMIRRLDPEYAALHFAPTEACTSPLDVVPLVDCEALITKLRMIDTARPIEWELAELSASTAIHAVIVRIVNSPTIGDALQAWQIYSPTVTNTLVITGDASRNGAFVLTTSVKDPESPAVQFLLRWITALNVYYFFQLYNCGACLPSIDCDTRELEVLFERINRSFDFIQIRFSRNEAVLSFPATVRASPLRHCDPLVLEALDQELRSRLAAIPESALLSERIRHHILRKRAFDCSQEDICAAFAIEPRKLRRMLQAEGTSLTEIRCGLRRDRAMHLVSSTAIPLKQVATELAYNSIVSFSTAFKAWTGITPGTYRKLAATPSNGRAQDIETADLRRAHEVTTA